MMEYDIVYSGTLERQQQCAPLSGYIGPSQLHDRDPPRQKKGGAQYEQERKAIQAAPTFVPPTRAEIVHCRCVLGWSTRKISRHFHIKMAEVYVIEAPIRARTLDLFGESA